MKRLAEPCLIFMLSTLTFGCLEKEETTDTGETNESDEVEDTSDTEDTEDTSDTEDTEDTDDIVIDLGAMPRIGAFLTDLDPESGGTVYFDNTSTSSVLTFVEVPLFDAPNMLNTFQIELRYATNEIAFSYLESSLAPSTEMADGGLAIGVSDGNGQVDTVDLSQLNGTSYANPIEGFVDGQPFDLEYKQVLFTPSSDASGYSASVTEISELPNIYSNTISVMDDNYLSQELPSAFTFYGSQFSTIFINNDGNITFNQGDTVCVCWVCPTGDGECASRYLAGEEMTER